ncbi:MAG: mercuric reductase [Nitrospiria bacterium]
MSPSAAIPPSPFRFNPDDEYNRRLLANVHPHDWVNPRPNGRYNLVVIGGGTAGLVAAAGAAGLGAKVALIEKQWMGGDCLNVGCVPSKALLRSARAAVDVRDAARFGVGVSGATVDFAAVMERMRRIRAQISPHDSAARFAALGVDVFFGEGRLLGGDRVQVGDAVLSFAHAVIATGGRAAVPPIPGLSDAGFYTNETVFSLTALPRRVAVIGGGPIGCELAQAFRRFGAEVRLLEQHGRILNRDDAAAAEVVHRALVADGVTIRCGAVVRHVSGGEEPHILLADERGEESLTVDAILVGVGRAPNVEGLGLEAAGVAYDGRRGVIVDEHLRTTNRRIFAAGDVCSPHQFTHAADAMARVVIHNALFGGRSRADALIIPRCTYTDPELAHVGLSEGEASQRGIAIRTFRHEMAGVDRAVLDGEDAGFIAIHVKPGTGAILGATIVARHAGDLIAEVCLAMTGRLGLGTLAKTIHPYPTRSELIKRAADAYNRSRLTPRVKRLFTQWLSWTR